MSKYLHKSPLSHICTNHSLRYIHSVNISRCTSNSDLAITSFGAMPPKSGSGRRGGNSWSGATQPPQQKRIRPLFAGDIVTINKFYLYIIFKYIIHCSPDDSVTYDLVWSFIYTLYIFKTWGGGWGLGGGGGVL